MYIFSYFLCCDFNSYTATPASGAEPTVLASLPLPSPRKMAPNSKTSASSCVIIAMPPAIGEVCYNFQSLFAVPGNLPSNPMPVSQKGKLRFRDYGRLHCCGKRLPSRVRPSGPGESPAHTARYSSLTQDSPSATFPLVLELLPEKSEHMRCVSCCR